MNDLLAFMLRERPAPAPGETLFEWWRETRPVRERFSSPVERALASGFVSDRAGFAFAAGYEAALHALIPSLPSEAVGAFCVTEEGGGHPRAIRTRLEPAGDGGDGFVLNGKKRWSTMAPASDVLIVIATTGEADGRPLLKAVRVDARAPGLTILEMPSPAFVPEVPHAELAFDAVRLEPQAVLSGDGFTDYSKAFRTVEDVHVNAAVTGYLSSVALRFDFPDSVRERLFALSAALCKIAPEDPRSPETHVVLAGILTEAALVTAEAEPSFALVGDRERERWYRDRALVQVASKARAARRERAWGTLIGAPIK